ncbi:MAG: NUDIX hydrolase [Clostridiales bacterium]|nr:NUDIX hydrolase [Clostridiales bacterium]
MRTDQELAWEPVSVEHIVRDEWIDFRKVRYRYPDGREFGPFYQYSRKSYSVIVPVLPDGRFLCVRQFRQGIGETTTEFPAGGIEAEGAEYGRVTREGALAAAKRELKEETGYESDEWTHLITIPSNATIADNYAHVFLARNCRKVSGLHLDVTEDLEPVTVTKEEIETMISEGRFQQMGHVMAYLLAVRRAGSL